MLSGARRALRMFLPRMVCNELVHFVAMDKKKIVLEDISDQDSDWETNVLLLHSLAKVGSKRDRNNSNNDQLMHPV